jgi:hypothetical protein
MQKQFMNLLLLLTIALISACGGGGAQTAASPRTIKAVIKPSALAASQNVAGINLSITVPVGVAPPLKTDGTADPAATVEITSSAPQNQTLPGATYTAATAAAPGRLDIFGIVASGFQPTDTITIHLNIATGSTPKESDFNLLAFDAFDTSGAAVTGLSPTLTTTIY